MNRSGKGKIITFVGIFIGVLIYFGVKTFFFSDYTLRSEKGKFTVTFPSKPERDQRNLNVAGMNIELNRRVLKTKKLLLQVGYSDYPDRVINNSSPNNILTGATYGGITNMGGEIVEKSTEELRGNPGMKAKISVPASRLGGDKNGEGYMHVYLAGNRLYQVLALRVAGKSSDQVLKRFLNSFTIWKK